MRDSRICFKKRRNNLTKKSSFFPKFNFFKLFFKNSITILHSKKKLRKSLFFTYNESKDCPLKNRYSDLPRAQREFKISTSKIENLFAEDKIVISEEFPRGK